MNNSHKNQATQPSATRRSFLNWLWVGLGLAALAEIVWVVNSFLTSRKPSADQGSSGPVIVVGHVDNFQPNTVTAFPRGQFYVACLATKGFLAISRRCTHLGCTVPWDTEKMKFVCPCHSSTFDIHGSVIDTPAPRALDLFRVTIENNMIKVHTGERIKRSEFRTDQVVFPKAL
jgi:cytochrome b6-f complex iron-sulfur subunit